MSTLGRPTTASPRDHVLIVGTGAMACWLGGLLARDGATAVTLAGSWRAALERLARDGIAWRSARDSFRARVQALPLDQRLPAADHVIVLVKAMQIERVAPHAVRAAGPGAPVVSLQNGLGARELLERAWREARLTPPPRIARGVITAGARLLAAGEVEVNGAGRVVLERVPSIADRLRALAERLHGAGIDCELVDDVRPHVWRKLVANCAVNALSALHGVCNGALLERADLRASFDAAAREAGDVARALGVDLGTDPVELAAAVAAATAANRSSMLQDLERGAPTEIDSIHGAVAREGVRLGVPTPTLQCLWQAVSDRETGGRPAAGR